MNKKYLPIGTVVRLNGGQKPVMIISYLIFTENQDNKKIFDYGACVFPEGAIDTNHAIGFNHTDIAEVLHLGLINAEQKEFNDLLVKSSADLKNKVENEIFHNNI